MPIQTADYWDEQVARITDAAKKMRECDARVTMLKIAEVVRQIAADTRDFEEKWDGAASE
jgi:hypothetical protein